jgi:hypothetical protein
MQSAMQASKVRREVSVAERNHMRAMQQHAYTHWIDYHLAKISYFIEVRPLPLMMASSPQRLIAHSVIFVNRT